MIKKSTLILIGIILVQFSCQKDYYLEDLNAAEAEYQSLNLKLKQINSENQQLISENQQLAFQIDNLKSQIESSSTSVASALSQIEEIEEHISGLEQEIEETFNAIESRTVELLNQLQNSYPEQTDLKNKIDDLLEQLSQNTLSTWEADALYLEIANDFAIIIGVQDGFYKTYKRSFGITKEDFQNQNFELRHESSRHYYYEIKDKETLEVSIVRKHNDPEYFDNPYSSEPFLDKSIWFSDTYEMEVLGADRIKVVEWYETGDGTRYDVMHLSKVDSIPYDRTNEELQTLFREKKTGFFSDPVYSQVDVTDLSSFLLTFIEDGKRYGRDMSWINPSNYNFRFDEFLPEKAINGSAPNYQVGYDLFVCKGGGRTEKATFRINKDWWDRMAFVDQRNLHIQIFWRIFARTLFTYDYFEGEGHLLSYGGSDIYQMTFDDEEEKYNFQEAARKMFQGIDQISWSSCSSKGTVPINTSPNKIPLDSRKVKTLKKRP